jgi:hypothetical protein
MHELILFLTVIHNISFIYVAISVTFLLMPFLTHSTDPVGSF